MLAVLERDFVSQGTRPRAFLVRGVVAAAAACMVFSGILGTRWVSGHLGTRTFEMASWIALFSLVALTSVASVDAVVDERIRGTLPLVLSTPEGPRGFALGKFASRAAMAAALFSTVLPFLAVCQMLDGGPWARLLRFAMLAAAVVLECVSWALLSSAVCRRFESATLLALALPPARWWATVALGPALFPGSAGAAWLSASLTPAPTLLGYGRPAGPCPRGELADLPGFLRAGAEPLHLLLAVLFAALAVKAVAALLAREGTLDLPAPRRLRLPLHRAAWRRALDFNPLLAKDLLGSRGVASLLLLGVVAVVLGAAAIHAVSGPGRIPRASHVHVAILGGAVTASSALAALAGATLLAQERAQGTLPLLRITRLPLRRILAGKVLAALPPTVLAWAFGIAQVFVAGYVEALQLPTFVVALVLVTILPLAFGVLGLGWGLSARTPGSALGGVVAALLLSSLGCGWWIALPTLMMARDFWEDRVPGRFLEDLALPCLFLGSPWLVVAGLIEGMEALLQPGRAGPVSVLFLAAVAWFVGNLLYLWWGGKDLPRRFREAMLREEELPPPPPRPGTPQSRREERRRAEEERRRALFAPLEDPDGASGLPGGPAPESPPDR